MYVNTFDSQSAATWMYSGSDFYISQLNLNLRNTHINVPFYGETEAIKHHVEIMI